MSISSYRSSVERLQREIAELRRQRDNEYAQQLRYQKDAHSVMSRLSSSSNISASTLQSYLRDLQNKQNSAHQHEKRVTDFERRIADKGAELNRNLGYLERELDNQRRQQEQADKRRRDDEKRHQQDISRELDKQLRAHREMSRSKFSIDLTTLPDKITVLFLGSNPLDLSALQLDEEARAIDRMVRQAEHRDAINFKTWWATRPQDLLQAINENNPTIVHFSGHGDEHGNLVFQGHQGESRLVTPEAISASLATFSESVDLVFFNACFSATQASLITNHIKAAIGMSDAVNDDVARVFAAQFYSSVGFGRSLQTAFEQARAALLLEGIGQDELPVLMTAPEVDPAQIYFVTA